MPVINNKEDRFILTVEWKKEMERQNADYRKIDLAGLLKLFWWETFQKYRLVYFMKMVVNGMNYEIAWKQANETGKNKILFILLANDWHVSQPAPHIHKFEFQYRTGKQGVGKDEVGKCKCGEWGIRKYAHSEWNIGNTK